jgi:putative peptidoglycan lipid II flippase
VKRLSAAALLLAGSVLLSRVLGFLREIVLAGQIGVSPEADAYSAAFQIPDLLNYFLAGGALSIAFVPLYTRAKARSGAEAAGALLATVLGTVTAAAVLATALLFVWAEPLVAFQFPRFDAEKQALTARLTRIVLPAQIAFVAGGIIRAGLMAEGRFLSQALAPVLYNAGIIAGGLILGPSLGAEGFAWGALIGAFIGPLGAAWVEARGRIPLRLRVAPLDAAFRRYFVQALPLMLGVTLLTVDEWYDRWFGQLGDEGTIAALRYARQLMLLPVAVVGQAIATAALPTLSRLHEENRREELAGVVQNTLGASIALACLAGAATWALAEPIVAAVYQRGAFDAAALARVAPVLAIFAFAIPGWITQQIAVRVFYAQGDTWRPMLLGSALAALAIPLYALLGPRFGAEGLASAGAIAISANALATLIWAQVRFGLPTLGALAATLLRALIVAAGAGAAAWGALGLAGAAVWPRLLIGGCAFALVAAALGWWVGDEAMRGAFREALRKGLRRG